MNTQLISIPVYRASVSEECITAFNDLKLAKKHKYIVFKLSDDNRQIVIEETSDDKDWENFREKLVNATHKSKSGAVGKGPRYAVYDFEYALASGEGSRNKITFIAWSPDDAGVMAKMVYAASKDALKRALNGIATEIQANDQDDIEYDTVLKTTCISRNTRERGNDNDAYENPTFRRMRMRMMDDETPRLLLVA
ncbi:hypothetical protein BJ170DRAFT_597849 [Xylariales sp. AK1849]|nr:hypothetical protein BJ170DRAFT_597849 [Xylariales sp. AK1849]